MQDHKVENFGSAASATAPKDTASLSSAKRLKVGSSKPDVTTPKTAVASPKVVKGKPKPKGSVSSPKYDSGIAKARAAGAKPKASKAGGGMDSEHDTAGTRTHSPRRTQATSGKLSPKADSVRVSQASANQKSGATSPKSGTGTARKSGVTSPKKAGVTGTKKGGVTSPRKGGVTSPRKDDVVSPKTAAKKASASRVASPRKAGSQPSSQKRTKVKTHMAEDASAADESKNKEARAAFKRQRGRRKSVVAAAMAKLRKSLKPEQEGGSKSSGETTLSSKDQMSLFLVATVAGFLLVFMATLIFVFFVGGTNIPEGVSCVTDECLEAKEYLDSLLNDTRDPCTDFYGYVCGTWQEKGGSFHGEAMLSALFRLNMTLLHMRSIKRKEEIRQGMHILRPIYSGCYSYMSKPAKLKDALNDAQKFLDISQLMKAASFFDVVRYLVRQSLQVGVYTLFHIRFIYEAGRPMLFMTEGYTLAQKLGQPFDTGDAQQSFARVLKIWLNLSNVDAEMALLSDMDAEVAKIFQTGSKAEEQLSLREAVANMVTGVSAEDWVAAVSASQRQGIVLVPTDDIITRGSKIYKPATQTVVKRGLRNATFYLATNLEADVLYVLSTHMKISKSDVRKGLYCLAFTHKCLALTWAYLAARLLAPVGSTGVIFNILKFMKEIVQETDEVLSWMKNTTAVKAKELLSKTSLDVIAGEGFNISRVDYTGPEPQLDESEPFLKNLVEALRHHHTVMAANPPTRLEVLLSDLEFSSTFTYVPERKSILVPTLYQNNPYLYPFRVPDFFNYGTMAVLLANVLIAEVVGTSFGNPLQASWDDETRLNYTEVASCLGDRRASLGFGELSRVSGGKQKALILSLTMSVRLAYYALMKTFRIQAGTAKVFNDYWPAAEEVFFARFCLLWCSASNDANPLTPRERCMLPLYNMEEFVDHYGCKSHANFSTAAFCKV